MSDSLIIIKRLAKNARDEIVVSLSRFKGKDLVDLRIYSPFYGDESGEGPRPTTKGVAARIAMLPELIAALQDAEAEAIRRGLLPAAGNVDADITDDKAA